MSKVKASVKNEKSPHITHSIVNTLPRHQHTHPSPTRTDARRENNLGTHAQLCSSIETVLRLQPFLRASYEDDILITSLPLRVKPVYPFQHFRFPDADWGPLHPDPQSETVEFLFFNFQRVHVTEEEDKQERSCLSKKIYQCVTKECFSASGMLHFIEEAYCFKSWSRHPLPRLYSVLFVASYY